MTDVTTDDIDSADDLSGLSGAGTATGDKFAIWDVSAQAWKSITRAELKIALEAAGLVGEDGNGDATVTRNLTVGSALNAGANTADLAHSLFMGNDSWLAIKSDAASEVYIEAMKASDAGATKYTLNLSKYGGATRTGGSLGVGVAPTHRLSVKGDSNTLVSIDRDHATAKKCGLVFSRQGFQSWELGPDIAANGTQDFFIFDSVAGNTRFYIDANGHLYPGLNDNSRNLGSASYRMAVIYAGTGTINTSGRAAKVGIREPSAAEREWARLIKARGCKAYQFKDAVDAKGDAARLHFGYVVEDILEDAVAAGIEDPWRYAFLCRDKIMATETYTEKATREKKRLVEGATEPVIEMRAGRPVMVNRPVERWETVGAMVDVVDEAGNKIMVPTGEKADDGRPVLRPLQHFVPELEEYDAERTREVETGEYRLGLRYSELEAFLRCAD